MRSVTRAVLSRNLVTSESLLDPDFVRQLEALKRRLDVRARSGHAGERSSNRRGGAAEFAEHRPYAPGDDLRRMDWLAYAGAVSPRSSFTALKTMSFFAFSSTRRRRSVSAIRRSSPRPFA